MRKPRRAATALRSGSAIARSRGPKTCGGAGAVRRLDAERLDELAHVPERHRADLRHVLAAELHRERLGPQALALAGVARAGHEKAPELVVGDAALAGVRILVVGRLDAHVGQRARRLSSRGTMPT